MKISITRIDQTLPMPDYQSSGAAAFDLYAREQLVIAPQSLGFIPSNLIIKTPPGFGLIIAARSSTPKRKGLLIPHGFGLIDQDYCGPEDEIKIQVYNFTNEPVTVERGERIAQGFFAELPKVEFIETDPHHASRGGFGSTGS